MTRKVLENLPDHVRTEIEALRKEYKRDDVFDSFHHRQAFRSRSAGYLKGLRDAGLITEQERRVLSVYVTI